MANEVRLVATGLAAGRLAIGVGLWLAPRHAARALGFESIDSRGITLSRIAATRDFLLGLAQLESIRDPGRFRRVSAAGMAADAADAVAFGLAFAQGERRAGLRGLALAVPATVIGAWLASYAQI
jgi:hypothetical protein